jgi:hypothetical protein
MSGKDKGRIVLPTEFDMEIANKLFQEIFGGQEVAYKSREKRPITKRVKKLLDF